MISLGWVGLGCGSMSGWVGRWVGRLIPRKTDGDAGNRSGWLQSMSTDCRGTFLPRRFCRAVGAVLLSWAGVGVGAGVVCWCPRLGVTVVYGCRCDF